MKSLLTFIIVWPCLALSFSRIGYVVNSGSGTVTPIDLTNNIILPPIIVGGFPENIALTRDGKTAFVTNSNNDEVERIDLITNTVVATIPVLSVFDIALTSDDKTAWVTAGNSIVPIDTTTNTVGTPIVLGGTPAYLVLTSDNRTAYVTDANHVTPVDLVQRVVGTPFAITGNNRGIAITPDNNTVYVTTSANIVIPIDTATHTVGSSIPVGNSPHLPAITPDGTRLYVPNRTSNTISVIDTATNTVINTLVLGAGTGPFGVAIDPLNRVALVSLNAADGAQTIDIPSDALGNVFLTGDQPEDVAISQQPFPPSSFRGVIRSNIFLDRTEYVLEVTIGASTDPVQLYRIFKNGVLVLETSNLTARFCLGTSINAGGFSIASVLNGSQSDPIPLIIG